MVMKATEKYGMIIKKNELTLMICLIIKDDVDLISRDDIDFYFYFAILLEC